MNNWRLLLLAVVVVVQPIGSFTESNLIDGRECCERAEDARLYGYSKTDQRRSLNGNHEDRRTTNEEQRLRSLQGIREEPRHETFRGPMLARSESLERRERRTSPELRRFTAQRLTREQERRGLLDQTRETREDQNRNRDELRDVLGKNKRDSSESRNLDTLHATHTIRVSRNARDTRSIERESRNTMSRLQIRNSKRIEDRRVSPNRDTTVLKREQEGIARHDSRITTSERYNSRIQLDNNRERRVYSRRTQDEGTEFRQPRISNARFNGFRVAQTQRAVEQSETNNRDSKVVRIELERHQRNTELRDRVSAVRRISAEKMRESRDENARLAQDRMDIKSNEQIDEHQQQRHENRRSMDFQRNTAERHLGSRQTRASRTLEKKISNDEQVERRLLSMLRESIRLSRASEMNTRNERAARIQFVRDEAKRRQEPANNRISRDRTTESRRIASRIDVSESFEERRQQREVKAIEQSPESRRSNTRRDIRESSKDRRQVNRLSKDRTISALREVRDTKLVRESIQTVRKSPEERVLLRKNSRLSRGKTAILREIRDNTEQEARDESSELRQRVNNRLSSNRISILRADREAHGSTERALESRKVVSPSRIEVNFRKLDSRNHQEVQDRERSDSRHQERQRSITKPHVTRSRSISVERRNYARATSRASQSAEASRIREDSRLNERNERQRLDSQRSSRPDNIRLERLVRKRAEIRDTERREERARERQARDDDRTRILTHRRSDERVSDRRENRESFEDSRNVRMTINQDAARGERILTERREENRAAEDSRIVRAAKPRNLAEVRGVRVIAERISENRGSRNARREIRMDDKLDSRLQRDAARDSRETSSQRESRDAKRLNVRSRDSIALADTRNERGIRINEMHIRFDRNFNTGDARRESKSVRSEREESRIANGEREQTRYRIETVAPDTLVEDSNEPVRNWQMVFYTLQGIYLCGLLIQMLTENANKSKKRTFNWCSSSKNLIKVD